MLTSFLLRSGTEHRKQKTELKTEN